MLVKTSHNSHLETSQPRNSPSAHMRTWEPTGNGNCDDVSNTDLSHLESGLRIQVESSCLLSGYGLSTRHLKRRQGAGAGTQSCHQCGKCSEFGSTWETSITNGNLYLCEFCVSGAFREHCKNTWRVVQPLCTSFAFVCKIVMPIP